MQLEGPTTAEVDEMYVGGRSKRIGASVKPKTPVLGVVEGNSYPDYRGILEFGEKRNRRRVPLGIKEIFADLS